MCDHAEFACVMLSLAQTPGISTQKCGVAQKFGNISTMAKRTTDSILLQTGADLTMSAACLQMHKRTGLLLQLL